MAKSQTQKPSQHQISVLHAVTHHVYYREKPLEYISSLLNHEGEGSVYSYLKKRYQCIIYFFLFDHVSVLSFTYLLELRHVKT